MYIDPESGLLDDARFIPSPNFDERPVATAIDLLVIHNISLPPNEFGGPYIEQLFSNNLNPDIHPFFQEICDLRVSSHLLIRRDGEILQFVPFHKRAWHAGESNYQAVAVVMTLPSALNWKVPMIFPMKIFSISGWLLLPVRCKPNIRV